MSGDKTANIVGFAKNQLDIDLMPWQAQALDMVLNQNYSKVIVHPRRSGRVTGIRQMNAVLDELRDMALWMCPPVELATVYQVAAKYLPEPVRHADIPQMRKVLDLVV
jgi:hypothetical protein